MAKDRRPADELSIEELEALLARKKLEARQARVHQFRRSGRALRLRSEVGSSSQEVDPTLQSEEQTPGATTETRGPILRSIFNRTLLVIEIAAVLGLAFILYNGVEALQLLNREAADVLKGQTPTPTPLISAVVLPSGHTPPTSPGGARPNESEIPESLRPLVQSLPVVAIPTPGPEQARSIFIPALWNAPAPVVQGDGWEQLKRGVGQHIGSANPGVNGNLVLSAHNDIFGELFRDLDRLKPGDEIFLQTATRQFTYRVTGLRIVAPTEVSVLAPTVRSTVTLISCYPYLVDNQRIVVFGELVDG
ncbi:MAG: sortase [Anaerolineales bacterium]|nr:sortase [Anaerolineales bacterium]